MADASLEVTIKKGPSLDDLLLWILEPVIQGENGEKIRRCFNITTKRAETVRVQFVRLQFDTTNGVFLHGYTVGYVVTDSGRNFTQGFYIRFSGKYDVQTRRGKITLDPH